MDGAQAGVQGGLWGRSVGEQEDLDRRVFRGVEVVLAVIAGDGVRLDLDVSVSALGELVDAPVVTFALGEDDAPYASRDQCRHDRGRSCLHPAR